MGTTIRIIAVFLAVLASSCLFACAEKEADNESQIQILDHNLNMHKFGGDVLQSVASADGRVKNTSDSTAGSVSIAVKFYDKDGNLLYTGTNTKQNLEANGIWIFNVQFIGPDAWKTVRYDISISTGR